MTPLADWATFYEVLGSASAALTGLQFVTVALLADIPIRGPGEEEAGDAFATPTIVNTLLKCGVSPKMPIVRCPALCASSNS